MADQRTRGKQGPDALTNDAVTFIFLMKAHSNDSYE